MVTKCSQDLIKAGAGTSAGTLKSGMKKPEIAKKMARESGVSPAEAADRLDRIVHQILASLKKSGHASLPGLGTFTHRADGKLAFELEPEKRNERV